ncbi:hypothetical protein Ancab_016718 [Ancistrocladus abbreviatus]
MSTGFGKCSKIRHIVRLRQMLRRWRNKAAMSSRRVPSDVPPGHVAVSVGTSCRRFVIRTDYLNHPVFRKLLVQAEEEYGFSNQGPLTIPCDETLFEEVLRFLSHSELSSSNSASRFVDLDDFQRYCHVGNLVDRVSFTEFDVLLPSTVETLRRMLWETAERDVRVATESSRVRIGVSQANDTEAHCSVVGGRGDIMVEAVTILSLHHIQQERGERKEGFLGHH